MPSKPLFVIVDAYSMAYRHYYGTQKQGLTAPDGRPTGAIYGFTRQIMDIMLKDKPNYVAVAFDEGFSGREEIYPAYKAHRDPTPEDFIPQIDVIYEVLNALNVPALQINGFEADDVIGTLVREAEAVDIHSRIVTGDGDLLQLITENTDVFLVRPYAPSKLYDRDAFFEKYELEPPQLVDLKALQGDTSDNIPGVAGVGAKTATKLLQEYHSLPAIYANLGNIKASWRKKLEKDREQAWISYQLAAIQTDLPLPLHLPDCVTNDFNTQDALPLFESLGFNSLIERLHEYDAQTDETAAPGPGTILMTGQRAGAARWARCSWSVRWNCPKTGSRAGSAWSTSPTDRRRRCTASSTAPSSPARISSRTDGSATRTHPRTRTRPGS